MFQCQVTVEVAETYRFILTVAFRTISAAADLENNMILTTEVQAQVETTAGSITEPVTEAIPGIGITIAAIVVLTLTMSQLTEVLELAARRFTTDGILTGAATAITTQIADGTTKKYKARKGRL